jgi:hypothetical protein
MSKNPSPVQSLLSLILEQPDRIWKVGQLLDQLRWEDTEENRRRLWILMGRVARKMCFEKEKILLHLKEEYWIARKIKADRTLAEKRLRRILRTIEGKDNRFLAESEICAREDLVPQGVIYRLRKQLRRAAR